MAAYHPVMMVRLLLYGYCLGVMSSRRIERATYDDLAFRYLAADQHPDHDTIAEFRKQHLPVLAGLFTQVLQLCGKAGLIKLGHVAIDGTKLQANASKHKAMSYGRMEEKEKQLKAEVEKLLAQAAEIDAAEDKLHGKGMRGDELSGELARRESRLNKIAEAKAALEQEAREHAEAAKQAAEEKLEERRKKEEERGKKFGGRPAQVLDPEQARPEATAQRNFTDPESRIMPDGGRKGSFVQGYNAQIAVEPDFQLIVGQHVTQAVNDKQQLQPTVEDIRQQAGQKPQEVLTDSGYCSDANLKYLEKKKIEGFIATDRESYRNRDQPGPRGPLPLGATRVDRMRRKLQTKAGAAIYATRKPVVEPVFGQIKQARGFRQFLLRGVDKVQGEWAMICLTHNILKLYRLCYG